MPAATRWPAGPDPLAAVPGPVPAPDSHFDDDLAEIIPMRNLNRFTGALLLAALASMPPAFAGMGPPDPADMFAQADTNHDGVVSRQELLAARAARFDKLDRNHDGVLTDADMPRFVQHNEAMMQKFHMMQQMADANGNGQVDRDEFVAAGERMFAMLDSNHDGVIDQAEMQQGLQRMHAMAGSIGAGKAGGMAGH